ncbi:MAG: anti-sigma factor antagonist [Frankiaceae bacterium]|nr:anti-sigma factor antagonist [Frankiaceae bacterium]
MLQSLSIVADVVTLDGRLDVSTAPDIRILLHRAVDAGMGDLVVDLARLDVLDASGLGVLIGAHRRAVRAGRQMFLRNVPPQVMRLLWVTRLQRVLHVEQLAPAPATVELSQETLAAC